MKPYERFINRRYVKMFNHFLKEVVEKMIDSWIYGFKFN